MGPKMEHLIDHHWDNQRFVPRAGRFLGMDFGTGRGVAQDNSISPKIFNIVVYAVVRAVLEVVCGPYEAHQRMG